MLLKIVYTSSHFKTGTKIGIKGLPALEVGIPYILSYEDEKHFEAIYGKTVKQVFDDNPNISVERVTGGDNE